MKKLRLYFILLFIFMGAAYALLRRETSAIAAKPASVEPAPPRPPNAETRPRSANGTLTLIDPRQLAKQENTLDPCRRGVLALVNQLDEIDEGGSHPRFMAAEDSLCSGAARYQARLSQYERTCRASLRLPYCRATLFLLKASLASELMGALPPNEISQLPPVYTKFLAYDWHHPQEMLPLLQRGLELEPDNVLLRKANYAVVAADVLRQHGRSSFTWLALDDLFHEIAKLSEINSRLVEIHVVAGLAMGRSLEQSLVFIESYQGVFKDASTYNYLKSSVLYRQRKYEEALVLLRESIQDNPHEPRYRKTLNLIQSAPENQFLATAYTARLDFLPLFLDQLDD